MPALDGPSRRAQRKALGNAGRSGGRAGSGKPPKRFLDPRTVCQGIPTGLAPAPINRVVLNAEAHPAVSWHPPAGRRSSRQR